jgi:hypothetical protein
MALLLFRGRQGSKPVAPKGEIPAAAGVLTSSSPIEVDAHRPADRLGGSKKLVIALAATAVLGAGAIVLVPKLAGQSTSGVPAPLAAPLAHQPAATTTPSSLSPASPSAGASSSPAASLNAQLTKQLATLVPQLESFVEKTRGLNFTRPVMVTLLSESQFAAKLAADGHGSLPTSSNSAGELRALGLLAAGADQTTGTLSPDGDGVVGFYDHTTKQVYLQGTQIGPFVTEVLAGELTQAIDDQHFGLAALAQPSGSDESQLSSRTLSIGDAVRVASIYRDSLSPEDQASADSEANAAGVTPITTLSALPDSSAATA